MNIAVVKAWMTLALVASLTTVAVERASANLTPFQQLPFDQPDVTSLHAGPAAAMLERQFFFQAKPQPVASKRAMPCTVQMVVFEKSRLAQACY